MNNDYVLSPVKIEELAELVASKIREHNSVQQIPESRIHIKGYKGLSKYLQCSEIKALKVGKSGKFPRYQDGRKVFFLEDEVLAGLKIKK